MAERRWEQASARAHAGWIPTVEHLSAKGLNYGAEERGESAPHDGYGLYVGAVGDASATYGGKGGWFYLESF